MEDFIPPVAEGPSLRLRPVRSGDAAYVHGLRMNPIYNRHLSSVTGTVLDQRVWIERYRVRAEYGLELVQALGIGAYDGVLLAVAHDSYREAGSGGLRQYGRPDNVFCDLKSVFARDESDLRL